MKALSLILPRKRSSLHQFWHVLNDGAVDPPGHWLFCSEFLLWKPAAGTEVLLEAFSSVKTGKPIEVKKVSIPGSGSLSEWSLTDAGLSVHIPDSGLNDLATVLKIETGN